MSCSNWERALNLQRRLRIWNSNDYHCRTERHVNSVYSATPASTPAAYLPWNTLHDTSKHVSILARTPMCTFLSLGQEHVVFSLQNTLFLLGIYQREGRIAMLFHCMLKKTARPSTEFSTDVLSHYQPGLSESHGHITDFAFYVYGFHNGRSYISHRLTLKVGLLVVGRLLTSTLDIVASQADGALR